MLRNAIIGTTVIALASAASAATYSKWSVVSTVIKGPSLTGTSAYHATVTPSTKLYTSASSTDAFNVAADAGYRIAAVVVDGQPDPSILKPGQAGYTVKTTASYPAGTFTNNKGVHSIKVMTQPIYLKVTMAVAGKVGGNAAPVAGGACVPGVISKAGYGVDQWVKVIPQKGWKVNTADNTGLDFFATKGAALKVADGAYANALWLKVNATADKTVNVTFTKDEGVNLVVSPASFVTSYTTNFFKTSNKIGTTTTPNVITFDASKTTTKAGGTLSYSWSVDGTPVAGATSAKFDFGLANVPALGTQAVGTTHTYAVTVTVDDSTDAQAASTQTINVAVANPSTAPDPTSCNVCHLAGNAAPLQSTAVRNSAHNNGTTTGATTDHATGLCQRCHTMEGFIAFASTMAPIKSSTSVTGVDADNTTAKTYTMLKNVNSANGDATVVSAAQLAASGNVTPFTGKVVLAEVTGTMHTPTCNTCHTQHAGADTTSGVRNTGNFIRKIAGWNPSGRTDANEYDLCTSCHGLTKADGTLIANGLGGKEPFYHDKDWYRGIASTHYDNPATANGTTIEGYNVRKAADHPCFDCHNHSFETNTRYTETSDTAKASEPTIFTEWAMSGHAGKLLTQKYSVARTVDGTTGTAADPFGKNLSTSTALFDTVMAAGVTDVSGVAWNHYNWDNSTGNPSTDPNPDRKDCQRCHTATGSSNFLKGPATYNAANNDFSHLSGWATNKYSDQNEVLYCWGCHSNTETGALVNPGRFNAEYNFQGATFQMPDMAESNVCFACHSGRVGGDAVAQLGRDANAFTSVGFKDSHYMAAAGVMFAKIGYTNFVPAETAIAGATGTAAISYGQSLTADTDTTKDKTGAAAAGKLTSTHRKLGTSAIIGDHGITAAAGVDTGGPCVACHYAGGSHTLEMDANAYNKVCVNCHEAEGLTAIDASNFKSAFIEPQSEVFQDALALATKLLKDNYNIAYDKAGYPYMYDDNLAGGHVRTNGVKDWTRAAFMTSLSKPALTAAQAEKLMGAAFNVHVLTKDPAAFAHGRTYARRLLYDSLDFLDDMTINQSVGATALASGIKGADGITDIYTKGAKAFDCASSDGGVTNAVTVPATGTSESMTYLLGWVRSGKASDGSDANCGKWNAWERP